MLNSFVAYLDLNKRKSELCVKQLKSWNITDKGVSSSYHRTRQSEFCDCFKEYESLVYCDNTPELMNRLGK
jgi:hypothetical protein